MRKPVTKETMKLPGGELNLEDRRKEKDLVAADPHLPEGKNDVEYIVRTAARFIS